MHDKNYFSWSTDAPEPISANAFSYSGPRPFCPVGEEENCASSDDHWSVRFSLPCNTNTGISDTWSPQLFLSWALLKGLHDYCDVMFRLMPTFLTFVTSIITLVTNLSLFPSKLVVRGDPDQWGSPNYSKRTVFVKSFPPYRSSEVSLTFPKIKLFTGFILAKAIEANRIPVQAKKRKTPVSGHWLGPKAVR